MKKSQLIEKVAQDTGVSKSMASNVVNSVFENISTSLQNLDPVSIPGFGTFSVKARAARTGHNPKTGEKVAIPEHYAVSFKPGATLKNSVR